MSIVSLTAGVASFVIVPFIGAIVAIITGHMARGQIRRSGEDGRGLALAGLALGYLNLVLCLLAVAAIVIAVVVGLGLARSQPA